MMETEETEADNTTLPENIDPVDTLKICYFCHKPYDSTIYERIIPGTPQNNIHRSCINHLKPEHLSEPFLSWEDSVSLPLCKKCLFCAEKLSRMNEKLEEIQKKINRFVNALTVDFLKSRRNIYNSKLSESTDYTADKNTTGGDTTDGEAAVEIKKEPGDSTEYFSDPELGAEYSEDIYSGYDSNEEMLPQYVEMKQEVINNPVVRRGRGRPRRSELKKPGRPKAKGRKSKAQTPIRVNLRRMECNADGTLVPNSDSLPRRKAAVKAEATFPSWAAKLVEDGAEGGLVSDAEENLPNSPSQSSDSEESDTSWTNKNIKNENDKTYTKKVSTGARPRGRPRKHDPYGIRNFRCKYCEKTYKNRHHLREHENTHDTNGRFQCTLCDASYSYVRKLRKHLMRHIKNEPLDKRRCKKPLIKKEKPQKEDKQPRNFTCKICNEVFNTSRLLYYHTQSHKTPNGEFKCDLCTKLFKNAATLQKHGRVHTGENKFLCSFCGKEFKSRSGQKDHERLHSEDQNERLNRREFECPVCHKMYSSKSSLNKHSFRHNEEKQFACQICEKRFATKGGLQTHMIYHKGERPFLCEECGKSFFTKTKLKEHNRIHTGMLFPCEYCDKGFQTTTHLKQHYRSHNKKINEKEGDNLIALSELKEAEEFVAMTTIKHPEAETVVTVVQPIPETNTIVEQSPILVQCPNCDLKFDSQNSLSNHMLIHSEEFSHFLMASTNTN